MRPLVLWALAFCIGMRLFELWRSRRNARSLLARGGHVVEDASLPPMVALHILWFVAWILEESLLGPTIHAPWVRWSAAALFGLAEITRLWCIATLGDRWNVRVIVIDGEPPVARGPYRWLHHPNYVAALVMIGALPVALGLGFTALVFVPLKLGVLRRRIRIEDRALQRTIGAPG